MPSPSRFWVVASFFLSLPSALSCLPENGLRVPVDAKDVSAIDEATFNAVLDRIESVYSPIVAKTGHKLVVDRQWQNPTVNAYASEAWWDWYIHIFGGLARYPGMTPDALALMSCHELGHHLGGAPKKRVGDGTWQWAGTEGQADYYATLKCFRIVFGGDPNPHSTAADPLAVERCRKTFPIASDERVCERATLAAQVLATVFADCANDPQPGFETPDLSTVDETVDMYPSSQCRLDTFFDGATCAVLASVDPSDADPTLGACSQNSGLAWGYRPRCWYNASHL